MLAGDVQAAGWVSGLLVDELPAQSYGRALLSGSALPPIPVASRGAQICNCLDVTEPQIQAALAHCKGQPEAQLLELQTALKCGTECGSCVPTLRQMILRRQPSTAAAEQPA